MAKKRKPKAEATLKNIILKSLIGAAIGTAVFFAITLILSFFCLKRDTDPQNYGFIELAVGAIAGFACGFFAVKPIGKNGLVVGGLSSLPMYFVTILICLLVSHTGIGALGWVLAGVMFVASAVGGFVAI